MNQVPTPAGRASTDNGAQPRIEPSQRWVRVEFNGQIVADSKRPLLVWPAGRVVAYYFPWEDVNREALIAGRPGSAGRQYYDLVVGERTAVDAAWSYPEVEALSGYVTYRWSKMDHWYEEEEEIYVHPHDPYHRADALQSSRHVEVFVDGVKVADTRRPVIVFETGLPVRYYIPKDDVRLELLEPSDTTSRCPYKGLASYWSVRAADELRPDVVWFYMDPLHEVPNIKGLLCFNYEKAEVYVDGVRQEAV
jgi:uncharacterized protein (DUF427 family)